MKLFSTYNRISIGASILIFLGGCVAFYFVLRFILIHELDKTLETEQEEIVHYVGEHNQLPEPVTTRDQIISYQLVNRLLPAAYHSRKIPIHNSDDYESVRELSFGIRAAGIIYQVRVRKSQVEAEDLLQIILWIAVGMIALILAAGYVINRVAIKRLWKPFYSTIGRVENYRLAKQESLELPPVRIEEFNLLNQSLNGMIEKIQQDYQILKDFTGNAAHEMQTPLAVIRSYLEQLQQDEHIIAVHNNPIRHIGQSVNRLSRLNQSLLLLAKIENHQFLADESIVLDRIVTEKTAELAELIQSQGLSLDVEVLPVMIRFHHYLAEVVVSNLLHNAIRYNKEGGRIRIRLAQGRLMVSNTSELPGLDREKIFQRFYRHPDTAVMGNGLGLSIVQQIASMAGLQVSYVYGDGLHQFSVDFGEVTSS